MAAKRKSKTARAAIIFLCTVGFFLIFLLGSGIDITEMAGQIWNSLGSSENTASAHAAKLVPEDSDSLLLYIIDTGNSDSMVLRSPDGHSVLIDAGESDDAQYILDTLSALGIRKLDAVVATHPHADHIGSMVAILKQIPADVVYMTDFAASTQTYEDMLDAIEASGIPTVDINSGDTFDIGAVHFTALNPQDRIYDDANNSSIVLLAEYGDTRFLFEGDAEDEAISDMLAQYSELLDADVLKVGHHGSRNATTSEFLKAVTPETAIITCGEENDYGHPHQETLDLLGSMGVTTLRTDQDGDIAIFSDGAAVWYAAAA